MTASSTEVLLAPGQQPALAAVTALRLVAAPSSAPPYDDQVRALPPLRLVPALRREPDGPALSPPVVDHAAVWLAATRTPTELLPAAGVFARTLVQAVLEVLAGVRPVKQLKRDLTPELFATLQVALTSRPPDDGRRPGGDAVRSLHVQERPEGIVEACATVVRGARSGALALRLEGLDGRWRCTVLTGL